MTVLLSGTKSVLAISDVLSLSLDSLSCCCRMSIICFVCSFSVLYILQVMFIMSFIELTVIVLIISLNS